MACTFAVAMGVAAFAASQGATGDSSTGQVEVNLTTGLSTRLTGLADFTFGPLDNSVDAAANQNICVGRSGVGFFANGTYRVRATGDGDPTDVSAFTLTNGTDRIYYDVFFNDALGTTGRAPLTAGVTLTSQQGLGLFHIFNLVFGCVARNANLSIDIPAAARAGVSSGVYTGTLTLVLIPD